LSDVIVCTLSATWLNSVVMACSTPAAVLSATRCISKSFDLRSGGRHNCALMILADDGIGFPIT